MNQPTRILASSLAAIALAAGLVGSAGAGQTDLQAAKAATARFHDLAVAGAAGFGAFPPGVPLHSCIASLDNTGAMGFHWLNPANLNTALDPTAPQVLVYAPDKHGQLKLAALEYVIFQDAWYANHAAGTMPMLFGQEFMPNNGVRFQIPAFFALHVWLFQDNPSGMFASYNPNVSCGNATASSGSNALLASARLSADVARKVACSIPGRSA